MKLVVVFLCLAFSGPTFQQKSQKWDGLKVTFGLVPSTSFQKLPRTVADAVAQGFKKVSDCDSMAQWRGARYVKDHDYAVVLLFDINGYIAGIQTTVPKNSTSQYPSSYIRPPFVEDGNRWAISAYFTDPSTICTTGRSESDYNTEGTGSNLYLQNSTSPEDSILIPHKEVDIGSTKWTKGKCFLMMGVHYWYDQRVDSSCDHLFPGFLLYNKGELTAFGWALQANLHSDRYEHPFPAVYDMFMDPVPTCLRTSGTTSSIHIYLTDNVVLDLC